MPMVEKSEQRWFFLLFNALELMCCLSVAKPDFRCEQEFCFVYTDHFH